VTTEETLGVTEIRSQGGTALLKEPLTLCFSQAEDLWWCSCSELPEFCFGSGTTEREALEDFKQDLLVCYESLRDCPDKHLTLDAQELKKAVLSLVVGF